MVNEYKIVEYDIWCPQCKHKDCKETDEPCYSCMGEPVNLYSHKPVKYERGDIRNG